ncbi:MAG: transketolase family protein, partial [Prolixibacteraceae bacterium]|nr:transketolase family protein [Burkholderiales bacterium]
MNAPVSVPTEWRSKSANQTRLAFGQALLEIGAREPRAVVVSADTQDLLGIRSYIERFRDRFIELGIAEQNVIGAAAGLATTGLHPYVCAYAPFISARSMEQVRNDVAYANQRVVIGAAASGISLGVAGGTHHSLEDLALMRSLPNMTVIVPADVNEAYKATLATLDIDGPVYLRLGGRAEEPPVGDPEAAFRLGKAVQLRPGMDVAVI